MIQVGLKRKYEDDELLEILRSKDRYHSIPEWKKTPNVPSYQLYFHRFGGWVEAWQKAGFEVKIKPTNKKIYDVETMLDILRQQDRFYSKKEWRELQKTPSYQLYLSRFGNWESAWIQAGYTREEMEYILTLKRLEHIKIIQKIGKFITPSEWNKNHMRPSPQTLIKIFGSWENFFEEAGIDISYGEDPTVHKNWNKLTIEEQDLLLWRKNHVPYRSIGKLYGKTGEAIRVKVKKTWNKLNKYT